MITIKADVDIESFKRGLRATQQRQIPFATALALTNTAKLVKKAEELEIIDVFDRPTPYTQKSLFMKPATKSDLNAYVWLKDERAGSGTPADVYLKPQIIGGQRIPKKFEKALESVGVLPPGWIAVPGEAAKLDAYGNMNRGQIVQILSYFRTFGLAGFSANITEQKKQKLARGTKKKQGFAYFAGRVAGGKSPLGIWQRVHFARGSAVKPVLIFVNGANYSPIFDFAFVAKLTYERNFGREFAAAFTQAVATAR